MSELATAFCVLDIGNVQYVAFEDQCGALVSFRIVFLKVYLNLQQQEYLLGPIKEANSQDPTTTTKSFFWFNRGMRPIGLCFSQSSYLMNTEVLGLFTEDTTSHCL